MALDTNIAQYDAPEKDLYEIGEIPPMGYVPKQMYAWTIRKESTAPQAAGVIHTDFERGFIRAECYLVGELEEYKSERSIREAGKLRSEGKDYIMQDGAVVHFLFNV